MTSETGVIKINLEMDFRMNSFLLLQEMFFYCLYVSFFFVVVGFCIVAADNRIMNYSCSFCLSLTYLLEDRYYREVNKNTSRTITCTICIKLKSIAKQ